jgi:2-isopropylmalate synthase
VSTDVIEASILSCLAAVNRMLDESAVQATGNLKPTTPPNFANDMLSSHSDKRKEGSDA